MCGGGGGYACTAQLSEMCIKVSTGGQAAAHGQIFSGVWFKVTCKCCRPLDVYFRSAAHVECWQGPIMFIWHDYVNVAICFPVWPLQLLKAKLFQCVWSTWSQPQLWNKPILMLESCTRAALHTIFSARQELWCVFNANLTLGVHSLWLSLSLKLLHALLFDIKNKSSA